MAVISGVKVVTTAGTAVRLSATSLIINGPVTVKALSTNTGLMFVGNVSGDVQSTNGFPLAAGDVAVFNNIGNAMEVWVNSAVNGEGVAWLGMEV